jgi:hypothetical protein
MNLDFSVRRIVTGHDKNGRAIVADDELVSSKPRHVENALGDKTIYSADLWGTAERPVRNDEGVLAEQRVGGRNLPETAKGERTIFRIVTLPPGSASPMHRTETVDYAVLLEGECDLVLDGGEVVSCRAGDVVVQRGSMHSWVNRSSAQCRWAWVLIDAEPVMMDGRDLTHEWAAAPRGRLPG